MVLLVFVPGLAFTASLIACFKAGLVGVPVYPPDPTRLGKELHHFTTIQQDCGAKVVLTHGTYSFAKTIGDMKGFFSFGKKETVEQPAENEVLPPLNFDALEVLKPAEEVPAAAETPASP